MEILQAVAAILLLVGFAYASVRWGVDTVTPANSSPDGRPVRWALRP